MIWPEVIASPHYQTYKGAIEDIRREFENGDDVNGRLSNLAHRRTYSGSPPSPASLPNEKWLKAFWRDKDRTRVTLDAHHLHMGQRDANGIVGRTGPLLFVGVMADTVVFLTIGDHKSFDDGTISKLMNDRLDASVSSGEAVVAGPGVTLGGTQVKDTFRAIDLVKQLSAVDAELTKKGFTEPAQKAFVLDFDHIVIVDRPTGKIEGSISGLL